MGEGNSFPKKKLTGHASIWTVEDEELWPLIALVRRGYEIPDYKKMMCNTINRLGSAATARRKSKYFIQLIRSGEKEMKLLHVVVWSARGEEGARKIKLVLGSE